MGRKVFITILGDTDYCNCEYSRVNQPSEYYNKTRFVQLATLQWLKAEEWENGVFVVGLTENAERSNWFPKDSDRESHTYLKEEMERLYGNISLDPCRIPDGKDKYEMMDIFDKLYNRFQDEDDLYFDLTTGFRYLPMLVLVLANYTSFLKKNITIKHMSYGFCNVKTEKGTFTDLMPLINLQNWTFAAGQYIKSGYVDNLSKLGGSEASDILQINSLDEDARKLNKIGKKLEILINTLITCRGVSVFKSREYQELRDLLESNTSSKQFNPIINRIKQDLSKFDATENIYNCFHAAEWCAEKKLYQQATTFLEEFLISYFCFRNDLNYDDEKDRNRVTCAITYKHSVYVEEEKKRRNKPYKEIELPAELNEDRFKALLGDPQINENCSRFYSIIELRNDFQHCGFRFGNPASRKKGPKSPNDIFKDTINDIRFVREKIIKDTSVGNGKTDLIFINLSNHPSKLWPKKQLEAANAAGCVYDIPFPSVNEQWSELEVEKEVLKYCDQIYEISQGNAASTTIHVMGEMTFTYAIVKQLKLMGYRCVASTTKRLVTELPDGTKNSTFEFCQFREY